MPQEGHMPDEPTDAPTEEPTDDTGPEPDDDDGQLDPRAKAKITKANNEARNLRQRLKELEPLAAKAKELEEAGKSDLEKAIADRDSHMSRAEKAEREAARLQVAIEKGLTATQAKRLVGSTPEELAADADALLSEFRPADSGRPRAPRESLRPGAVADNDEPLNITDLVKKIPRQ